MAIVNNILGFVVQRTHSELVITKTGTNKVEVNLYRVNPCVGYTDIEVLSKKEVESVFAIRIPILDGIYKLRVTSTNTTNELSQYKDFLLYSYSSILNSFIKSVKEMFYKCNVKNDYCDNNKLKNSNELLLKILSLYLYNKKNYDFYLDNAYPCIECNLIEELKILLMQETIYGYDNLTFPYKKIVGFFYIIFYIAEKSLYPSCIDEINEQFDYINIAAYLMEIGVDIKCIEDNIFTHPDYKVSDEQLKQL